MCRLLGVISRGPVPYDLFEEFANLCTQGRCPDGPPDARGHSEGWGLVAFRHGELLLNERGAGSAKDDPLYYKHAWRVARVNAERSEGSLLVVLAHIRRASAGMPTGREWTHPRVREGDGTTWAFAHNGGLNAPLPPGTLDTDVYFDAMLGGMGEGFPAAIRAARERFEAEGDPSSLTALLSDGRSLHACRHARRRPEYYTLHADHWDEAVVLCSEPLPLMRGAPLENGEIVSVDGDLRVLKAPAP